MQFSIAVNMERAGPFEDMRQVAAHALELVRIAEDGGFEIAWAAEHHTIELIVAPNPFLILTNWAAHTRRIRLGTAVVVAPYWHPIRVAEEAALADIYSDGRLEFGIGRGAFQYEFDRMAGGIPQQQGVAWMKEMLPAVLALWRGDYVHEGEFWRFPIATAVPKPLQRPHPPLWVAARDPGSFDWAVKMGANVMATPLSRPEAEVAALGERYRGTLAANPGRNPRFLLLRRTCVYEDPASWRQVTETSIGHGRRFDNLFQNAGGVSNGFPEPIALDPARDDYRPDTIRENMMFGTPDEVVEKLKRYEAYGVQNYCYGASFGLPHATARRSLELFIERVMPHFTPEEGGKPMSNAQSAPLAVGLTRRATLGLLAGAATLGKARADGKFQGKTITFASWGGSFQQAQKVAYCDPFSAKTGATVLQAGPIDYAKFRTMVEGGNPDWNVADVTIEFLYDGAKEGLFERIDPAKVDLSQVDPRYVHEYGVGDIVWSYNIGYSTTAFPAGAHPKSWADVFDVNKFPGRRTLRDRVAPMLEIALLADGVPLDKLYPLDVDRAFKKLDTIKKNTVWWKTNSQSQQLFVDGEVTCGLILNGRAYDAVQKGGKMAIDWNQNIQSVDYLVIPKGSKNVDVCLGLIQEMTGVENQAKVASMIAYSPTNPKAFADIDKALAPWLSTNPENAKQGFVIDAEYWRDRLKPLSERWEEWKLS